ncbi:MAG TPA: cell division protein ZapA [Bacteroidales bacterium]|nr:cell division protein ZapA [Bacteroidales bacterium]
MMNGEKITIRLNIAERYYPLTIARSEEEAMRKMAKQINEVLFQYSQRYPGKETQDYMAMSLLQYALKIQSLSNQNNVAPIIEKLEQLDKNMEEFLVQEQVL